MTDTTTTYPARSRGKHPGGRRRKSPEGSERTQNEELEPYRAELMQQAKERIYAKSALTLDRPTVESIVAMVNEGNYPTVAAKSLGVLAPTFQGWLRAGKRMLETAETTVHDPDGLQAELYMRVEEAEATFEVDIVKTMKGRIDENKNWTGHMTLLERRFPDRWARRDVGPEDGQTYEQRVRAMLENLPGDRGQRKTA